MTDTLPFVAGVTTLKELEKAAILYTLSQCGGDKKMCADHLGVTTRTIYNKLKEFSKDPPATSANKPPNYRTLLKRYMSKIIDRESDTLADSMSYGVSLSALELELLSEIEVEIRSEEDVKYVRQKS